MLYHVTTASAIERIRNQGLIPAIGPRSRKAGEDRPWVYLFPDMETAEDAMANWLGDELPDDEDAYLCAIREAGLQGLERHGFEVLCPVPVPPSCIIRVTKL